MQGPGITPSVPRTDFPAVVQGFFNQAPEAGPGGAPIVLTADVGSLAFTGFAPSAVLAIAVPAATGALTLAGQAPAPALAVAVPAGVGALQLDGQAPAPTLAIGVPLDTGALVLTGQSPAAVLAIALPVDVGSLVLAGLAPAVAIGAAVVADAGVLALDGLAPSPMLAIAVLADLGQLEVTGFAPELTGAEVVVPVDVVAGGGLWTTPATVSKDVGRDRTVVLVLDTGSLALEGYAPSPTITRPDPAPVWELEPWSPEQDSVYADRELVPAGVPDDFADDELLALFHCHEACR